MAIAMSASGGTGVGPGAKRYFFCMGVSSIEELILLNRLNYKVVET
jgi:hypothetical protein